MIVFGIWDIFYYVFLWFILGWPESLLTWDILFLIPYPWVGPVLAPVLVSLAMAGVGTWVIINDHRLPDHFVDRRFVISEIAAGLVIIASFLVRGEAVIAGTMPGAFPWTLFLIGWLGGLGLFVHRIFSAEDEVSVC